MKIHKILEVALLILVFSECRGQNFNITFFADTANDKNRELYKTTTSEFVQLFSNVADYLKKRISVNYFNPEKLNKGDILKLLSENADDDNAISVFWFSGYVRFDKGNFPFLELKDDSNRIDSKLLLNALKLRKGLNILVIDGLSERCSVNYNKAVYKNEFNPGSLHLFAELFTQVKGTIFLTTKPVKCNGIINNVESLLLNSLREIVFTDTVKNDFLSWKIFLKKVSDYQKHIMKGLPSLKPSLYFELDLNNFITTLRTAKRIEIDSVKITPPEKIIAEEKITEFLGDTIIKIIQNADSVSCKLIVTRIDSSGGKGSEYTYDVPCYVGILSEKLQSILQYIVLTDENYAEENMLIKHQFEPILTFTFSCKFQHVLFLYSPASRTFGFGFDETLLKKQYKMSEKLDGFFDKIKTYAKNTLK